MSSWYYLISQLPALPEDNTQPLPISEEYFYDLCSRFMDKKALKALETLSLEPPRKKVRTGSAFLDTFYDWERSLRFMLGTIRAQRMKKDFTVDEGIDIPSEIVQTARTACGYESPLEAELFLNKARAELLNRISPSDAFSTDAVFAYALSLKLGKRIRTFSEEAGQASYRKIYDQILENRAI